MRAKIIRATGFCLIMGAAACTGNPSAPRSENMPLRTTTFYLANQQEMRTMLGECSKWKASNTPIGAIPVVIVNNCGNATAANGILVRPKRRW